MRKSGQVSNPGGFSPSSIQKSSLKSVPINVIYRTYCPRTAAGMYSLSLFLKKIYTLFTHIRIKFSVTLTKINISQFSHQ